jgi:hypothetical protein
VQTSTIFTSRCFGNAACIDAPAKQLGREINAPYVGRPESAFGQTPEVVPNRSNIRFAPMD